MQTVNLDLSKLFGFKIITSLSAEAVPQVSMAAKIGQKPGAKIGGKVGAKVGVKSGIVSHR
jgi:hypothetical protein